MVAMFVMNMLRGFFRSMMMVVAAAASIRAVNMAMRHREHIPAQCAHRHRARPHQAAFHPVEFLVHGSAPVSGNDGATVNDLRAGMQILV